ncbi:MAG: bifunctional metallophosphatase/5'-nucleotidase, partial [bacterium]
PFKEHSGDAGTVGGIARIAALIERTREEMESTGGKVLLVCAGDILQGTPMSLVFKGEPDVRVMNIMRFDAMVIGNHEFDYGQENLKRLMGIASFPVISANIAVGSTGELFAADYIINSYDNLRVAIFGLTTSETPVTTHPDNVKDLEFLPPIDVARKLVPVLRDKADVVIALTHLGYEIDRRLALEVPGIDVIVGGHSHTRVESPAIENGSLVCQAYQYGICLGRADLHLRRGRVVSSEGVLLSVDNTVSADKEVATLVSDYAARLDKEFDRVVGVASVRLNGDRESVRSRETNLGDLVADVMRLRSGTDLALTNAGGIRASIDEGEITIREILTALPFGGELVTLTLTGRQIVKIVNRAAGVRPGSGAFLQVSGISFDMHKRKATNIQIAGEPVDEKRNYRVATNDFLASGGDGYSVFKRGSDYYNTGLKINDLVAGYIRDKGRVGREVEHRIVIE